VNRTGRLFLVGLIATLATVPAIAAKAPKPVGKAPATARAAADSSAVLVRVGGEPITRAMLQRQLDEIPESMRAQYMTPEGRQQVLQRQIEERVWMAAAARAGVADRPKVKDQIERQRRDLIIRTYLSELMGANPAPSDSEAKVYYDQHLDEYKMPATVTVRHLQAPTADQARKYLVQARAKGADFAALAKKFSTDTLTRGNGGLLGTLTRDGVFGTLGQQPAMAESAFALAEGQVGGPYKSDRGWHVLKVDARHEESHRTFEQMRPLILRQLSGLRSQDFYRGLLEKARQDLGVTEDSAAVRDFLSARRSARELFQSAQEAGPATERMALYQQILADYPQADVAPQAEFMVGFIRSEELKDFDGAAEAFRALLQRYPKSELSASAQWMLEHMRSDEAPPMLQMDATGPHAAVPADTTGKVPGKEKSKTP
jgi:peptidyl-prolyl cis-trans isomerase C